MAIRNDHLAVERKLDLAADGSGQIWRQRVSDQMGFCKIPVLIIQLIKPPRCLVRRPNLVALSATHTALTKLNQSVLAH